jgi:DNA repair exonuclease SbcCD ATPase subunit
MRTYEKILIFLFAATVALATFIVLPSSDNDEALRRFRSLLSKPSVGSLPHTVTPIKDTTSLYYGGISLVAIIMIGVALRMARGGDSKAPRQKPTESKPTTAEVGKLPSRGERSQRKASEAALQDSEAKARRIYALQGELSEKENLLQSRDAELQALHSQLRALTEREGEMSSAAAQEESALWQELERKTGLLQIRDSAIKDLERRFGEKLQSLEDQLRTKEELLKSRGRDIEELRSELSNIGKRLTGSPSANEPTEELLQARLSKPNLAIQLNEETESSRSFQDMGAMLAEKEELLKSRDNRIEKLEAELKEKRTELARYEIDIRQSIERRDLWKRRLANFGITLKD